MLLTALWPFTSYDRYHNVTHISRTKHKRAQTHLCIIWYILLYLQGSPARPGRSRACQGRIPSVHISQDVGTSKHAGTGTQSRRIYQYEAALLRDRGYAELHDGRCDEITAPNRALARFKRTHRSALQQIEVGFELTYCYARGADQTIRVDRPRACSDDKADHITWPAWTGRGRCSTGVSTHSEIERYSLISK